MTLILDYHIIPGDAMAQYSIDNGTAVRFTVTANTPIQLYNLPSFQTGVLSPGPHHLFVEYGVDNFVEGSAPLILDYFIIQNQTFPSVTSSPPKTTSSSLPSTTSSILQSPTITPNNIADHTVLSQVAIAGVVIGSLVCLALIIFALIRFIKRKKAAASLGREHKLDAAYYGDGLASEGEKIIIATL